MKEHGVDGDAGADGEEANDNDDVGSQQSDEEVGAIGDEEEEEAGDVEPLDQSDEDRSSKLEQTPGAIASQMTLLDIRDNDPLPDLSECKPRPQSTMTTKAAKKKAGWAI